MSPHAPYAVLYHAGAASRLSPGDVVGRMRTAAMRIDDPHVSEAHAYLSVRDGSLRLLGLRGGLAVEGRLVREVTLAVDLRIALAKDVALVVEEVVNPRILLALRGPGLDGEVLTGSALSVVVEPEPAIVGRLLPDAPMHLWTDGSGWMVRERKGVARRLAAGDRLLQAWEVVEVAAGGGDARPTALGGRLHQPLDLRGYFDAFHIYRKGFSPVVISGAAGRMLCELGSIGQPVHWRDVAETLWGAEGIDRLRKRWDILLVRLRKRLASESVRADLVSADGAGNVQLLLERDDAFVDHG